MKSKAHRPPGREKRGTGIVNSMDNIRGRKKGSPPHEFTRVPKVTISDREVDDLCRHLQLSDPNHHRQLKERLEQLSASYKRWRSQEDWIESLEDQQKILVQVEKTANRLVHLLEQLSSGNDHAEFLLWRELEPNLRLRVKSKRRFKKAKFHRAPLFRQDLANARSLRDAAALALKQFRRRKGPQPDLSLEILVLLLCELYEELTGKPATHTPYKKTEYKGQPESHAGRFVATVIKMVQPNMSASITQMVRRAAAQLKDKRRRQLRNLSQKARLTL